MKRRATKRIAALMAIVILVCFAATGCTEADQVSANISQEADNFNVTRKLTVLNARRYNPVGIDWNICTEE